MKIEWEVTLIPNHRDLHSHSIMPHSLASCHLSILTPITVVNNMDLQMAGFKMEVAAMGTHITHRS